jgi:RNA polymerase primary sigma factor
MVAVSNKKSLSSANAEPYFPKYSDHPDLRRRNAEKVFFGKDAPRINWSGRLTPDDELLAFRRMHFSASMIKRSMRKRSLTPQGRGREMAKWRARYEELRDLLVNHNMGLVYEMLRRSRFRNVDQDDLLSEGLMALLRSVQTYDPWRGYRFSTYACNSILRAFIREAMRQTKLREQAPMSFDPQMEEADPIEWRRENDRALFAERLNRILDHNLADLSETEQAVLEKRFPRDQDEKRLTLEKLGRALNVSKERVRQIQKHALEKLRETVISDPVLFDQSEIDLEEDESVEYAQELVA